MTTTDWAIFIIVGAAALSQLYFANRYREFFIVDSKSFSKSYISQILELKKAHPIAGMTYILLVAIQAIGFVYIAADYSLR